MQLKCKKKPCLNRRFSVSVISQHITSKIITGIMLLRCTHQPAVTAFSANASLSECMMSSSEIVWLFLFVLQPFAQFSLKFIGNTIIMLLPKEFFGMSWETEVSASQFFFSSSESQSGSSDWKWKLILIPWCISNELNVVKFVLVTAKTDRLGL